MEVIGFTTATLAIFPLLLENIKNPGLLSDFLAYYIFDDGSNADSTKTIWEKVIAKLRTFLLQLFFPGVWHQWTLIDKTVLPGDDRTVEQFRLSYVSDCNMTAVAGAIIAQVAITSLSLPQISQTHWVARAFFITSLISGCFAVYFACWSQKTIGTLFKPSDLKDWLTRRESVPLSGWGIRRSLRQLEHLTKLGEKTKTGESVVGDVEKGFLNDFDHLQEWQGSASLWSAFLLQVPFTYMKLSLGSFVIGLTIYLGFVWTRDLDQAAGKNDSRNIFIVLLVVVVACIYFYVGPALYKSLEVLPVKSWKEYQEKLKDFAETQNRLMSKNTQHFSPSDPSSKGSAKKQNIPKDAASDPDEISGLIDPSSSSALDTQIIQLSAALRASTSTQISTNQSIRILMTEIANLAAAIRDREQPRSLSGSPP